MRRGCYRCQNGHPPVPPPHRTLRPHHQNGFGARMVSSGAIIGRNIRDPASLLVKLPTLLRREGACSLPPHRVMLGSIHFIVPARWLVAEGGRKRVIPRFSCVSAATRGGRPCSVARSQFIALSDGLGAEGGSTASAIVIPTSQFSICSKVRGDPEKQGWYGRQGRQDRRSRLTRTPVALIRTCQRRLDSSHIRIWQTNLDSSQKTPF